MKEYSGYVGVDVHKDTIAVAVAWPGRRKPESLEIIVNSKRSLLRLVMSYLGLVPSEHSSGEKAKRGAITKTGNGRVRRLRVETAC